MACDVFLGHYIFLSAGDAPCPVARDHTFPNAKKKTVLLSSMIVSLDDMPTTRAPLPPTIVYIHGWFSEDWNTAHLPACRLQLADLNKSPCLITRNRSRVRMPNSPLPGCVHSDSLRAQARPACLSSWLTGVTRRSCESRSVCFFCFDNPQKSSLCTARTGEHVRFHYRVFFVYGLWSETRLRSEYTKWLS